jgi:hypothetical protein
MQPRDRSDLVSALVEGQFPVEPIRNELARYPWDAEEPLALLRREHVVAILRRYLSSELTAEQVDAWANALELRDDVGFLEEDSALLQHTIFVLANPAVNGDLTIELARELLKTVA